MPSATPAQTGSPESSAASSRASSGRGARPRSLRRALSRWKRWLTDKGVRVTGPYDRGWFVSIYFQDPDGQVLEIATAGPGFDYDEPIDALGQRQIQPTPGRLIGNRDEASIAAMRAKVATGSSL